ncbi:diadenosine tetraphosphate hydrolase [Flavobacterium akiainvivens]|uniref:Diadenosine tetraphosphate hydrolase n=1 Tax=Flavobacterium akiainvivens TaxID=1202724 RepID=A0A0M9VGW5_9FLAO|nr:DUF4269 domain-containing protein [Flavobacterium akiainvivens]KOS04916.1 diadenosine tetraphosphate hydrolase [Flavobacterium akiainvivens]SFQ42188.1 protein of unknown function [Flavobacterium akiainvivens]
MDFLDISYLKQGSATQQRVHTVLTESGIIHKLSAYTPVLAGTTPLTIDIEGSDLDILCYYRDYDGFISHINNLFSGHERFSIRTKNINGHESVIANFFVGGFEVEIFGQTIPVTQQYGYRHMIKEYEILKEKGEDFRLHIVALKQQGIKTEPAFALLLGLEGNPYEALLTYKTR